MSYVTTGPMGDAIQSRVQTAMRFKKLILSAAALSVISLAPASAVAADWHVTYYGSAKGTYFFDKDSVVDTGSGFKQFWILYAPRVRLGTPGEGYAYARRQAGINCQSRLAARYETTYTDENGVDHAAEVKLEKNPYAIVPDSEDDFWWTYLCKVQTAKELEAFSTPITNSNMKTWLADQVRSTRENTVLVNQSKAK